MNNWTIAGRIGRDAETREVEGGHLVTNFSVAVDEFVGGEKRTLWVDCSWWGDRGEKTAQYLTKGKSLTVSGKAGVRTYEGNNGFQAVMTMKVVEVTLQGGAQQDGQREAGGGARQAESRDRAQGGGTAPARNAGYGAGKPAASKPPASSLPPTDDFSDDDIPF